MNLGRAAALRFPPNTAGVPSGCCQPACAPVPHQWPLGWHPLPSHCHPAVPETADGQRPSLSYLANVKARERSFVRKRIWRQDFLLKFKRNGKNCGRGDETKWEGVKEDTSLRRPPPDPMSAILRPSKGSTAEASPLHIQIWCHLPFHHPGLLHSAKLRTVKRLTQAT